MIAPFKIKWREYSSLDFNVFTELAFESGDNGETETFLNKEAIVSEVYDGSRRISSGYKYNASLSFQITFIKSNFGNFTQDENRRILSWLTGSKNASFLSIYKEDSAREDFCVLGNWINVSQYKLGNSRIVGYVAEFESLNPYALSPLWSIKSSIPNASIKTMRRWSVTYSSVNTGPKYLYTVEDELAQDIMMYQYNGEENTFKYTGLNLWETLEGYTDGSGTQYTMGDGRYVVKEIKDEGKYDFTGAPYGSEIIIDVHTDEVESPIYPKITIKTDSTNNVIKVETKPADTEIMSGCTYYYDSSNLYYWKDSNGIVQSSANNESGYTMSNIRLTNTYTNNNGEICTVTSTILNNIKGETITLDGANRVIFSDRSIGRIFGDDFTNWTWIPLFEGINKISVTGNCTVTIEWREIRKVGQF